MTSTLQHPRRRAAQLSIAALHGEVHRFTGIVDRFGSYPSADGQRQTICLRDLQLAESQERLDLDHWWFRLRELWIEAGVRVGDTVLFTARVQRCTKGWADPDQPGHRQREQVIGFGGTPRSVVVYKRAPSSQLQNQALISLQQQHQTLSQYMEQLQQDLNQMEAQRSALLRDNDQLQSCLKTRLIELQQVRRDLNAAQEHVSVQQQESEQLRYHLAGRSEALEQERRSRLELERLHRRLRRNAWLAGLIAVGSGLGGGLLLHRLPMLQPSNQEAAARPWPSRDLSRSLSSQLSRPHPH